MLIYIYFSQSSDNSFQNSFFKPGSRQGISASSSKSISNLILSPKSPALSASFNESDEDENIVEDSKFDDNNIDMHTNGNMVKFILTYLLVSHVRYSKIFLYILVHQCVVLLVFFNSRVLINVRVVSARV
jgi:hypothetical protein